MSFWKDLLSPTQTLESLKQLEFDGVHVCLALICASLVFLLLRDFEFVSKNTAKRKGHILILCVDYTSHKYWRQTIAKYSRHNVSWIALKGSNFKWRMRHGAFTAARHYLERYSSNPSQMQSANSLHTVEFADGSSVQLFDSCKLKHRCNLESGLAELHFASDCEPHLIICDAMIDCNLFHAVVSRCNGRRKDLCPIVCYFHENQVTIPESAAEPKSESKAKSARYQLSLLNYANCLGVAQRVWFNSAFHRNDFLQAVVSAVTAQSRDDWQLDSIKYLLTAAPALCCDSRIAVMPIPMDFQELNGSDSDNDSANGRVPVIGWLSRWERDKNPALFVAAIRQLAAIQTVDFRLVILGESFGKRQLSVFDEIREELSDRILHIGFVESRQRYLRWLRRCDLVVFTAKHEFFGIALIEAMFAKCVAIVPDSVVYLEHFSHSVAFQKLQRHCVYKTGRKGHLVKTIRNTIIALRNGDALFAVELPEIMHDIAVEYDARHVVARIDDCLRLGSE